MHIFLKLTSWEPFKLGAVSFHFICSIWQFHTCIQYIVIIPTILSYPTLHLLQPLWFSPSSFSPVLMEKLMCSFLKFPVFICVHVCWSSGLLCVLDCDGEIVYQRQFHSAPSHSTFTVLLLALLRCYLVLQGCDTDFSLNRNSFSPLWTSISICFYHLLLQSRFYWLRQRVTLCV